MPEGDTTAIEAPSNDEQVNDERGGLNLMSDQRIGPVGVIVMTVYLVVVVFVLLYSLVQLWPAPPPASGQAPAASPVTYLTWTFWLSDEVRLLLIVVLGGALGGLVHALRSFYWYIGNRALVRSWLLMYLLLPFVGVALALVFYLVIRGGFFSPQATAQATSPFGFAALAALVGMFSPQAVLKLKDVAETVFTRPKEGADNVPQPAEPVSPRPA